ncbi:YncE family protein [Dysgonomonas sp. 511]|uniref:YncE family protein n=1 Tax=Dysgonomonas sp. 511 TaxID=2302930 RepID=UPI0013D2F099|nr:DUF5074 domain-containing protein [Dysgonomonas sp. 511]NDV79366.1 hypothetical protein [Dysgonomonas sp. 511]
MKKYLLKILLVLFVALPFISCDSDDDNNIEDGWKAPILTDKGAYILNNGNWGKNDGNMGYYSEAGVFTSKLFYNMNEELPLGDLVQDMSIYGNKMYVSVNGSNKIYIANRMGKLLNNGIIDPKTDGDQPMLPRYTYAHGGKVYVTTESAHLLRIDTTTLQIDGKLELTSYPETMTVVNNKMYVVNSQRYTGTSNIVSVVNLSTFAKEDDIEIEGQNPERIISDSHNNIYVIATGNYAEVRPTFQKINPETRAVTVIGTDVAYRMALAGNRVLLLAKDVENWGPTIPYYYDIAEGKVVKESFVSGDANLDDASDISVNPYNGDIYITVSSFGEKGKMYVYSSAGQLKTQFSTDGYFPMGAYFLQKN